MTYERFRKLEANRPEGECRVNWIAACNIMVPKMVAVVDAAKIAIAQGAIDLNCNIESHDALLVALENLDIT